MSDDTDLDVDDEEDEETDEDRARTQAIANRLTRAIDNRVKLALEKFARENGLKPPTDV